MIDVVTNAAIRVVMRRVNFVYSGHKIANCLYPSNPTCREIVENNTSIQRVLAQISKKKLLAEGREIFVEIFGKWMKE